MNTSTGMSIADFQFQMEVSGFVIFEQLAPAQMLERIRIDIPMRQEICRQWQKKNGLDAGMEGAAHHVAGGGDSLEAFLYTFPLDDYIRAWFGGEYILNSYGALNNLPYSSDAYRHG